MTKHPIRKALTGMLVMALLLVGTAVPALAVASGSVTIKSGADLLSGADDQEIVFTVNNTATGSNSNVPLIGTAGTSIDLVQFVPPAGFFDYPEGQDSFPVGDFTGPEGWKAYVQSDVIRFVAQNEAAEINPGSAKQFTLKFDVKPQTKDTSDMVFVSVSDDDGMTLTTAGVPNVTIRTLQVVPTLIDVVKPTGADVASGLLVTEGQDNAKVSVTVRNFGDTAQNVTPVVSKNSGTSTVTMGTATAASVPANGGETTFEVPVTQFGGLGTLVLQAKATATSGSEAPMAVSRTGLDADGNPIFKSITVQERIRVAYEPNTLTPRAVNPLATGSPTFTATVNKTGGPAAKSTGLSTELTLGSLEPKAASPTYTPAADAVSGSTVTFPSVNVTSLADNTYNAKIIIKGKDANGANLIEQTLDLGNVLIDRLNAVVNIQLAPPPTAVAGTVDAASFGDSVGVTGTVTRGAGACTDCKVDSNLTKVTMNNRTFPATANVSVDATGKISGTIAMPAGSPEKLGAYEVGDNQLGLQVTVGREVGGIKSPNAGTGNATAPVDIIRPTLLEPAGAGLPKTGTVTGRDADGDFVDVIFSERVNFGQFASAADWIVDGEAVTEVQYFGTGNSRASTDRVRLRLLEPLENNATPSTTYNPQNPLGRPGYDRVELRFTVPAAVDVADGIAPDPLNLVSLTTHREGLATDGSADVAQGPLSEGNKLVFVTRDNTPVLTVKDVLKNDDVTVFHDKDNSGTFNEGDIVLGAATNKGTATKDLQVALNVGTTQGDMPLGVLATDSNRNAGKSFTNFVLRLDTTRIQIASFARTGQNVTVTLTENVTTLTGYEGRNAAIDWFVKADGRWRPVETVSNTDGNAATRTLNVNAMVVPAGTTITGVRYEFVSFGPEADNSARYLDRALNEIADGEFND